MPRRSRRSSSAPSIAVGAVSGDPSSSHMRGRRRRAVEAAERVGNAPAEGSSSHWMSSIASSSGQSAASSAQRAKSGGGDGPLLDDSSPRGSTLRNATSRRASLRMRQTGRHVRDDGRRAVRERGERQPRLAADRPARQHRAVPMRTASAHLLARSPSCRPRALPRAEEARDARPRSRRGAARRGRARARDPRGRFAAVPLDPRSESTKTPRGVGDAVSRRRPRRDSTPVGAPGEDAAPRRVLAEWSERRPGGRPARPARRA